MEALIFSVADATVVPETQRRHHSAYKCFLDWAGPVDALDNAGRVDLLLRHMAHLAFSGRISAALQAAYACDYVWRLRFDQSLENSQLLSRFKQGLRKLRPLISEPQQLRCELPVSALQHFVTSKPPRVSDRVHTLVSAVLAIGMRAIQRGQQLSDLECADVSTAIIPHTAASPSLRWPPGFVLRLRIRATKTDPQGQRPFLLTIEPGISVADPVTLLNAYTLSEFGVSLLNWNSSLLATSHRFVFTLSGARLPSEFLRTWVQRVATHSGLEGRFGSHSLRISGACWAAAGGVSLETIMAIGGWQASSSTILYLRTVIAAFAGTTSRMGL